MMLRNSTDEIQLRRYRNNLEHAGIGYIMFGFWDVIKIFIMVTMMEDSRDSLVRLLNQTTDEGLRNMFIIIYAVMMLIISVVIMMVHLWIGRKAIKLSRGSNRRLFFLVICIIGLTITVTGFIPYFYMSDSLQAKQLDLTIASLIVDVTVLFIYVDMIYSVSRIKTLSGKVQAVHD